jgi:hypothetical protein
MVRRALVVSLFASLAGLVACRDDQDPAGAAELWQRIHEGEGFQSWRRAPGFSTRKASFTAHSNAVEIFVSPEIATTLDGPEPARAWPVGSMVVKEGFKGGSDDAARAIVAVMEKRPDGWYWAEYDDEGGVLFSGRPRICVDCHENRASHSDWVYSFELPR